MYLHHLTKKNMQQNGTERNGTEVLYFIQTIQQIFCLLGHWQCDDVAYVIRYLIFRTAA